MMEHLLKIEGLQVSFNERAHALRGVDLLMDTGEIHGLVGESGSGKTVTSTCVIGLLPVPPGRITAGSMLFKGRELLNLNEAQRRRLRGREVAMVFQEPSRYLNPAFRVGEQITEMLMLHQGLEKQQAVARALELIDLVGLKGGGKTLRRYPHELSGGMKQRAMIAMAISCNPSLLIADEPTTALDVTLQQQILELIQSLKQRFNMGILFISHDLAVVHEIADRISVIYAGRIVESTAKARLFEEPLHPYTRLLLLSIPDAAKRGTPLRVIPGTVPDAEHIPPGCSFHPRCPLAEDICRHREPNTVNYGKNGELHTAECHMIGKKWIDL
jgi:oligopeptide/dipeptide ABC transporter ATP-binding protein